MAQPPEPQQFAGFGGFGVAVGVAVPVGVGVGVGASLEQPGVPGPVFGLKMVTEWPKPDSTT